MDINEIVKRIKNETNNMSDIVYRKKKINAKTVFIIYNEPLISSDKISDFVIRSLTSIENNKASNLKDEIINNISNFKVTIINTYDEIVKYLHKGFAIILIEKEDNFLALEAKSTNQRSISIPTTDNSLRGSKDAFVEDYQTNIGLIKKRIRTNDLWIECLNIGKYTNTQIGVISINGVVKKELVKLVIDKLKNIEIDGVLDSSTIKNRISDESKTPFPTSLTMERPDMVSNALLAGKVAIVVDNCPYVIVIPAVLNDFFKTTEDFYSKSVNTSFTRIIKYVAFFIALMAPAIYIALITYNQEMIPTELLVNFATQRDGVPFPAFFEALIMMISFEILRESDLRVPSFTGSSLSIVGALILGEAAVNAGIVSPIMIIVIAITAISSLPFNEIGIINSLRLYRIIFMFGGAFMGIVGVVIIFIFFLTKITSIKSFGKPYLMPYSPVDNNGLKDSIIKAPVKKLTQRLAYLSDNRIRERNN